MAAFKGRSAMPVETALGKRALDQLVFENAAPLYNIPVSAAA